MKYVIYLRVSTDQQNLGIEVQRDICHKYISKNSENSDFLEFVDEGFSGALQMEKRPSLLNALSALEKNDILLIAKRDRLGRDPIVNAMIERAVERKKARILSASGDVSEDNDPSSILMRRMIDAFAEYERLIIGARTKAALQVKKKKGQRVGYIPYGYRLCDDKIHIEKCEKEQENLDFMKNLRSNRYSLREIAKKMNHENRFNRLGPWNQVSIYRVMQQIV